MMPLFYLDLEIARMYKIQRAFLLERRGFMYLGRNAKSRTPGCIHQDGVLELSTELFRIEWVASESGYKQHLHCDACCTTGKNALPPKLVVEFERYDDKPDGWLECDACGESYYIFVKN